jgi:hypothetical protein
VGKDYIHSFGWTGRILGRGSALRLKGRKSDQPRVRRVLQRMVAAKRNRFAVLPNQGRNSVPHRRIRLRAVPAQAERTGLAGRKARSGRFTGTGERASRPELDSGADRRHRSSLHGVSAALIEQTLKAGYEIDASGCPAQRGGRAD